jgi:type III pantothenate kinase
MELVLDIGNSQLYAGVFENDTLKLGFRKTSIAPASSDEYGLFLRAALTENGINYQDIKSIVVGSVVPDAMHSVASACIKYFNIRPMLLQAGVKTGLKIKYRNPLEVGADRIANSIAASRLYPNQNCIIVDFGTATTFCVLTKNKEYLGGLIVPGVRVSMEALQEKTAKLPSVEIAAPTETIGRSTVESIQSGLYHAAVGMVKEVVAKVKDETFKGEKVLLIGTGGFARLIQHENLFDVVEPDLVLIGLHWVRKLND